MQLDHSKRITVPVRDMEAADTPVVFCIDLYGLTSRDLTWVSDDGRSGADYLKRSLQRLGYDTDRYMVMLWDIPVRR